jgi:hypothetical protein
MIAQLTPTYIRRRPHKALVRLMGYGLFEGRALLQRGRWINPLVFTHFAIVKRLPIFRGAEAPIFIVGTGRSGTTILHHVLSFHRDVGALNEPKALWYAVHPEDDIIGSYSKTVGRYRFDLADASARPRRNAQRLYGAYRAATGVRRVVDKYPEMIFRVPYLRALFPEAKFLWLVRNGNDVVGSIADWSGSHAVRGQEGSVSWWGRDDRKWHALVDGVVAHDAELAEAAETTRGFANDTDRAAVEWVVSMREGLRWAEELPEAMMRVTYEELVADPESTLRGVESFCGLRHDLGCRIYAAEVLTPPEPRPQPVLHDAVRPAFENMQRLLGYAE